MKHLRAFPYLRPDSTRIRADKWLHVTRQSITPLPSFLPDWDYATDLELRRSVEIDVPAALQDCGLVDGKIGLTAVWRATSTRLSGALAPVPLGKEPDRNSIELTVGLSGAELGGTLVLDTQLVLLRAGAREHPMVPARPGTILWSDRETVQLEGTSARFPIEVMDFEQTGISSPDAAWYFDLQRDALEESALGCMVLYVNKGHKRVARAIHSPDADDETRAIISAVRFDVARTLIVSALENEDFMRHAADFPPGTLGAALQHALRLYWGDRSVDQLKSFRETHQADFESELQARLRLFSGQEG